MRKAVLIGFEYKNGKKLPGIAVDLYQVYCFLKNNGWKNEEILVLTDIKKDAQTEILKIAILNNIVDSGILSFIEDLKERKQYIEFKAHNYYNNFESIFNSSDYCFIYYTGHSKDGNIILPNESLLSFEIFKKLNSKEIFLILDCCEKGINLPFRLNDKIYRLENTSFVKSKILCISSSLENENSIASKSGSFFTRYLFPILNNPLYKILQKINSKIKETANISVSYPNIFLIFGWFYSSKSVSFIEYPSHLEITI